MEDLELFNFMQNNVDKNKKYFFKIILFIVFIFYHFKSQKNLKNSFDNNNNLDNVINSNNNIKICICTPGKKENRYIKEFVIYYEKYGVDKIFLYDNNDIDDEYFEDVIKDYVDKGFVTILNWRGINNNTGYILRNDCYLKNRNKFNWFIYYDIDEYINLKNYTNIKDFLNQKRFKKCLKINLNWVLHTDNNLIYYDNRTLHERFTEIQPNIIKGKKHYKGNYRYKFILRGNISDPKINYYELISTDIKGCNGNGKKSKLVSDKVMKDPDFFLYYIDHYYFKSVEEFVEKINKGDNYFGQKMSFKKVRIKRFFRYNKVTLEKIEYIENKTGINLSEFIKKKKHKIKKK